MKQMTIRSVDADLEVALEELGRKRQWSINQAAIYLMRKGLGLTEETEPQLIGPKLEAFFGAWSAQERQDFDAVTEETFGRVDEENWK